MEGVAWELDLLSLLEDSAQSSHPQSDGDENAAAVIGFENPEIADLLGLGHQAQIGPEPAPASQVGHVASQAICKLPSMSGKVGANKI